MTSIKLLNKIFPSNYHNKLFMVGGIVRDFLLGETNKDIDIVAYLQPNALISLGFRSVKAKNATTIFFLYHHELGKIEVTRLEPEQSLTDELRRRDFTINAMAMNLAGEIIDPHNGRRDLGTGTLRTCSEESFLNDPIRIFRAFRFEADGWRLARESETLIAQRDWEADFAQIPQERFSNEMLKAIQFRFPDHFFRRMLEFNVGRVFLPEIFSMSKIPAGPEEYHPEGELLTHSLDTLRRLSEKTPKLVPRFCALFHDLGKLATPPHLYPKHIGHDQAGFDLATEFSNRLKLPASLRKALMWTCKLHLTASRWDELRDSSKVKLARQAMNGGIAAFFDLIVSADRGFAFTMKDWDSALKVVSLSTADLGINPALFSGNNAILPSKRSALIQQYQVEQFRKLTQSKK